MNTQEMERFEHEHLKPYACFADSVCHRTYDIKGVTKVISKHPLRTEFQRDRDRIIHSKAFRRLEYKTQVFLTQHGDHLRTRLTHSLEVSQLSETIAIQLGLNRDLIEAIALGHDVGHTPFGHAGERKLDELLKADGEKTFKHNLQSVKVLKLLEKKYSDYNGLKLTVPVLEGILKHTKIPADLPEYCSDLYIEKPYSVTLEGQTVCITDEIAQITHDMDDYLRYNVVNIDDLLKHKIFDHINEFNIENYKYNFSSNIKEIEDGERKRDTIIRCLVDYLVTSLIFQSEKRLSPKMRAYEIDDIYIKFEDQTSEMVSDFHDYLNDLIFSDSRIKEMDKRGKQIIESLYSYFKREPDKLPDSTQKIYKEKGISVLGDYIAGMTDRYAINQYNQIINLY